MTMVTTPDTYLVGIFVRKTLTLNSWVGPGRLPGSFPGDLGNPPTAGGWIWNFLIWNASLMAGWRGRAAHLCRVLWPWDFAQIDRDRTSPHTHLPLSLAGGPLPLSPSLNVPSCCQA